MEGEGGRVGRLNVCVVSCRLDLVTLRQLRRALLVEMTVRQQHIDNQNDIKRDSEASVGPVGLPDSALSATITTLCAPWAILHFLHAQHALRVQY